jgi:8-oxo-dGTP pyrophosphatase MutT (NUDIX family)
LNLDGSRPLRPSASVIALRDTSHGVEVLLQQRAEHLAFGGLWAFPGGTLEAADGDSRDLAAFRTAAARELEEETGIVLGASQRDGLITWGRWITPARRPRRFDTWFFAAAVAAGLPLVSDEAESLALEWLPIEQAIRDGEHGSRAMLPPTYVSLLDVRASLQRDGDLQAMLRLESARTIVPLMPALLHEDQLALEVMLPWDPSFPADAAAVRDPKRDNDAKPAVPAYLRELPSRLRLARRPNGQGG